METFMKAFLALALLFVESAAVAQQPAAAVDTPEPGTSEAIAAATTDKRFLSLWVSSVPASGRVPSPEKFFGRIMGAPGELANSEKSQAYFRALAEASPRVKVFTIGRSEEDREIQMIAIADEDGIRNLEKLQAATALLADPRRINPSDAEVLIEASRPIYY